MVFRPSIDAAFLSRTTLVRAALTGFLLFGSTALPAQAALLPEGFFDMQISPGEGPAAVEADRLNYDARRDLISAEGDVLFSYQGYTIRADRLEYNQQTGDLLAIGGVVMRDPAGSVYETERIEVTGEMKEAFFDTLTLTTAQGAVITARDVRYAAELETVLTEASYSPCGLCVDEKGRRIGWQVKSARLIYDRDRASVTLEQPSLELLGIPVAWLPWFWVPDPTQPRATGLRMPSVNYSQEHGAELTVPFFVPVGEDADIILSPTLMSRQGFLARADGTWRFPGYGQIDIKASGIYQLDPSAYAGLPGDRNWRGAIQTAGEFTPVEDWKAGWSYSVFTDNAYLPDYALSDEDSSVNQVYATHLTDQTWIDARIQRFNRLGNFDASDDQKQGMNLPKVTASHVQDLEPGWGRLNFNGELLGVHREADHTGAGYDWGYEGNKVHAMVEGAWENQLIAPGGLAFTPYLGLRLDGAFYDGASGLGPPPTSLLSATPIAAMDVRWPLMGQGLGGTHLVEPIAQLVYRGSSETHVGINNDDAHSFVFDTSNLFSYNRFSGIDRQETGLRANIGGHYLGSFDDGSWLDLVAGQSFHLAGLNALGVTDQVNIGAATGLGTDASYIVASARGGFSGGLSGGAKVQVDPALWRITRAGVGVSYAPPSWFSVGMDYIYVAAVPAIGIVDDQHEIAGRAKVTMWDYWSVNGALTWDLRTNAWSSAKTGIDYDDGYLALGGSANFTPSSWGFGFNFKLKGPDGELAF
ncbi:MAG: LPS-assembly protein LptD [Hyphomicrobiales bacterium]|nr:MAG: LPS-assembly protein LptD [Hyphomicrobiales bacterium]